MTATASSQPGSLPPADCVDVIIATAAHCVHESYHYPLYSAVKQVIGADLLDEVVRVGALEGGRLIGHRLLLAPTRWRLRCAISALPQVLALCDRQIQVGEHMIQTGEATLQQLRPATRLRADWVRFGEGPQSRSKPPPRGYVQGRMWRALQRLGVDTTGGVARLGRAERRTVPGSTWTWGYPVELRVAAPADGLVIQQHKVGGGRCLGGGLFVAVEVQDAAD